MLKTVPSRMFIDGEFNSSNWNGGDSIIRQFLYDLEFNSVRKEYTISVLGCKVTITCTSVYAEDDRIATISVDGDVYYFSWYKSRGKTDSAKKNGNDITEAEYIILLNLLELTRYKFNL